MDLGTLGGCYSFATAVNGDVVVGSAYTAGEARSRLAYDLVPPRRHPDLGTLGGNDSSAAAVSGTVVVGQAQPRRRIPRLRPRPGRRLALDGGPRRPRRHLQLRRGGE